MLVLAWLLTAWLALRRRGARGEAAPVARWTVCGGVALLYASLRAYPWNYALHELARSWLRAGGQYEQRVGWKVLVGLLLIVAAWLVVRQLRRSTLQGPRLVCTVAVALHGLLLAAETFSLDDLLPGWVEHQPGRYLVEGAFVGLALWASSRRGR